MGYFGESNIVVKEYVRDGDSSVVDVNGVWLARVYAHMGLTGKNMKALLSTNDFSDYSEQPGLLKAEIACSEHSVVKTDYGAWTNSPIARYGRLSKYSHVGDNPSTRAPVD
jgi:hypothetical protein